MAIPDLGSIHSATVVLAFLLSRITQASYKLGCASVDKLRNTDELKNASIELINARKNFEDMWQSFSRGFTTYRE